MESTPAIQLVKDLERFANTFSHKERTGEFMAEFRKVHNTNQQNIFRLMMKVIEYIASDEFRADGRNEASKKTAQQLLRGFEFINGEGAKPSHGIPFI
jgi:adenine specific DNA methylase Mod